MELKYQDFDYVPKQETGSNRTFMELKFLIEDVTINIL